MLLGACCLLLAACWAWLHLSARRLRSATSRLQQWPPLLPLYYAALSSAFSKPRQFREHVAMQEQRITVGPVRVDVDRNLKLRRLCGDTGHDPQALAALLPAVEAFRLNLAVLAAPHFPVSVLGGVLYQYRAVLRAPLPLDDELTYRLSLDPETSTSERSTTVDTCVRIELTNGTEVWHDRSTFFIKGAPKGSRPAQQADAGSSAMFPSSDADTASSWHTIDCWALDGAAGRRFAALNGDCNPIHVSATLAQLFGFRSCVAHGMLLLARSVISIQNAGVRIAHPTVIEAEFRRPCFLPSTVECLVRGPPNATSPDLTGSVDFVVVPQGLDVSKQVVRGRVGFCQPDQTRRARQESK